MENLPLGTYILHKFKIKENNKHASIVILKYFQIGEFLKINF